MKSFLIKLILFLSIPLGLTISVILFLNYVNNKAFVSYKVSPSIQSLFVGDSHIHLTVDDKLLPTALNLSQNGEPFKFSFFKLQTILKNNPSIKKVYLGFGYHSVSSFFDEFLNGKGAIDISARYFFILPAGEKVSILKQSSKELPRYVFKLLINGSKTLVLKKESFSFLGKYENNFTHVSATKKAMDGRLADQFYEKGKLKDFSSLNLYYLNEIVTLCKQNNVELIALNTPLHPYYKKKVPAKFKEKYNAVVKQYNLNVVDLTDLLINDICFRPEGDHVSRFGALLTTTKLAEQK